MAFLIGAIIVSAVLAYAVVWYHRRPKSMEQSINEFSRGLEALAPRDDDPGKRRHRRRSGR